MRRQENDIQHLSKIKHHHIKILPSLCVFMSSHISRHRCQHRKQRILCLITRAWVRSSPSLPSRCQEVTGEIMEVITCYSSGRPPTKPDSHSKPCCPADYWYLLFQTMLFLHRAVFLCLFFDYLWLQKSSCIFRIVNEWEDIQYWRFWCFQPKIKRKGKKIKG